MCSIICTAVCWRCSASLCLCVWACLLKSSSWLSPWWFISRSSCTFTRRALTATWNSSTATTARKMLQSFFLLQAVNRVSINLFCSLIEGWDYVSMFLFRCNFNTCPETLYLLNNFNKWSRNVYLSSYFAVCVRAGVLGWEFLRSPKSCLAFGWSFFTWFPLFLCDR